MKELFIFVLLALHSFTDAVKIARAFYYGTEICNTDASSFKVIYQSDFCEPHGEDSIKVRKLRMLPRFY